MYLTVALPKNIAALLGLLKVSSHFYAFPVGLGAYIDVIWADFQGSVTWNSSSPMLELLMPRISEYQILRLLDTGGTQKILRYS